MIDTEQGYQYALEYAARMRSAIEVQRQRHLATGRHDFDQVTYCACKLFDLELEIQAYERQRDCVSASAAS